MFGAGRRDDVSMASNRIATLTGQTFSSDTTHAASRLPGRVGRIIFACNGRAVDGAIVAHDSGVSATCSACRKGLASGRIAPAAR